MRLPNRRLLSRNSFFHPAAPHKTEILRNNSRKLAHRHNLSAASQVTKIVLRSRPSPRDHPIPRTLCVRDHRTSNNLSVELQASRQFPACHQLHLRYPQSSVVKTHSEICRTQLISPEILQLSQSLQCPHMSWLTSTRTTSTMMPTST